MVDTVLHLQNSIRRLELRAEQLIIHLRSMERNEPGAERIRSVLLVMLLRLVSLKAKRARLEDGSARIALPRQRLPNGTAGAAVRFSMAR